MKKPHNKWGFFYFRTESFGLFWKRNSCPSLQSFLCLENKEKDLLCGQG